MIKTVNLENWKSIKKSGTELPTFGAIVGENAAGKSNFIQSIKLIKDLVHGYSIERFQSKISLLPSELINYSDQNNECKISIALGDEDKSTYELIIRIVLNNNQKLIVGYEKLTKVNEDTEEVIYTRDTSEFKVNGTETFPLNFEQNKLALSYYKNTDTDNIRSHFSNIIVPEFSDINNLNADVLATNDPSSASLANIIFDLIHNHPDVYAQFVQIVQKFMPVFKSFIEIPTTIPNPTNDPSKSKFLIVAEEENLKDTLSMLSLSDGDIRTLYLLATALKASNGSTFIIEEIENGIHPNRVTRLIDQLLTISRVKSMQIIFTTHSSLVINEMAVSQIILVEKDKIAGTQFKKLDKVEQISGIKDFLNKGGKLSDYIYSK